MIQQSTSTFLMRKSRWGGWMRKPSINFNCGLVWFKWAAVSFVP